MCFARWLFGAGEMSRPEFRRWARFNRRVRRRDEVAPIVCQGEGCDDL
jgi:predicted alpha/beta hydrolase